MPSAKTVSLDTHAMATLRYIRESMDAAGAWRCRARQASPMRHRGTGGDGAVADAGPRAALVAPSGWWPRRSPHSRARC